MISSLATLQAERDVLLLSAKEKDAELTSLRQQVQQQQSSLELEKDQTSRELEALRAQLQQQVHTYYRHNVLETKQGLKIKMCLMIFHRLP